MKFRQWLLCLTLTFAAGLGWAQDKVVYHFDDTATQALMTNFYTNLAKTGNRSLSFKQAQLQLMVKFKEPYYWGAFVMTGQ